MTWTLRGLSATAELLVAIYVCAGKSLDDQTMYSVSSRQPALCSGRKSVDLLQPETRTLPVSLWRRACACAATELRVVRRRWQRRAPVCCWLISIETVRRGVSCRTDGLFAARPARPYRAKSALLCLPHTHILVLIERSIDTACTCTSLLLSLSASTALCLSVGHHMHVNHDVIGITMTTICIGSHHGWNRVAAELPEITVTKETVIFFIYLLN